VPKIIGQYEDVFQTWVDGGKTSAINTGPSESSVTHPVL